MNLWRTLERTNMKTKVNRRDRFAMPKFREARGQILMAWDDKLITDEECLLLCDVNTSSNPDFAYWNYEPFNLDDLPDDDCFAEFGFRKTDPERLKDVIGIPAEITCYNYNDLSVDGLEALCILLRRLSYPSRCYDLIPRFGRPVPQLCMIFNQILDCIYQQGGHLIDGLNQRWLQPQKLEEFAAAIHQKRAFLDNVWGL